jgi:hypothetical protein
MALKDRPSPKVLKMYDKVPEITVEKYHSSSTLKDKVASIKQRV